MIDRLGSSLGILIWDMQPRRNNLLESKLDMVSQALALTHLERFGKFPDTSNLEPCLDMEPSQTERVIAAVTAHAAMTVGSEYEFILFLLCL